ncbi:sensor domain-containing diguanylate cyclase [Vibrio paucivorans]
MKAKRHFSLGFVLLTPLIASILILALTAKNYYDSVNRDISSEYERITDSLERATKVITALDYSFTNSYQSKSALLLEHNRQIIDDELCQMWPIDVLLLAEGKNLSIPAVDIDYMLVGDKSLCLAGSPLYERASTQVSLAPVLSFLHDLDDYLYGVHYIDREGYVISSPETIAENITKELLSTLKARPYWQITATNREKITVSGPAKMFMLDQPIITMTMPVFGHGEHQGMLSLDVDADMLLDSGSNPPSNIRIIQTKVTPMPNDAVRILPLKMDGVVFNHALYYELDMEKEVKNFFVFEKYSIATIIIIYVLSVVILFYVNSHVEKRYLKELAAKDPMTGLLNRRGMEIFLKNTTHGDYIALAVLDIDDFKKVNDTYGHDVGDAVICYMADKIESNIRQTDAVARFGGEEFVLYLRGQDKDRMCETIERVKTAISAQSHEAVEGGFTVSVGVEVVATDQEHDFDTLFKAADEKLYQAKTTGKNKVVF